MTTRPLWVDPDEQSYPSLAREIWVDVAIVGGGLTGMGAGLELVDRNLEVALLEANTLGSGASGRNAGFILSGSAMPFAAAVDQIGMAGALEVWEFTQRNNRFMAATIRELAIHCDYQQRGSMLLAVDDEEMALLRRTYRGLVAMGVSVQELPREELPDPFKNVLAGGMKLKSDAEMNSGAFVRGLARARLSSLAIYERTPVAAMSFSDRWELSAPGGVVHAGRVILATNGALKSLWPALPVRPVRGQALATAPLKESVVPCPAYANYGHQYWRQTTAGEIVVGGWRDLDRTDEEETSTDGLNPEIQSALKGFSRRSWPQADIEYRWSGIMGFTPDLFPVVGAVPEAEGLFVAAGYSGHGVCMAMSCGVQAALLSVGEGSQIPKAFEPARFA